MEVRRKEGKEEGREGEREGRRQVWWLSCLFSSSKKEKKGQNKGRKNT